MNIQVNWWTKSWIGWIVDKLEEDQLEGQEQGDLGTSDQAEHHVHFGGIHFFQVRLEVEN